jgi:hypothetical protein
MEMSTARSARLEGRYEGYEISEHCRIDRIDTHAARFGESLKTGCGDYQAGTMSWVECSVIV